MSYTTYQAKNGVGVKGCFAGSMIFDGLGGNGYETNVDLSNYYTKAECDDKFLTKDSQVDLTNYYNKTEVDDKITEVKNNLPEEVNLENYYNKSQIDEKITEVKETIPEEVNLENYVSKEEINISKINELSALPICSAQLGTVPAFAIDTNYYLVFKNQNTTDRLGFGWESNQEFCIKKGPENGALQKLMTLKFLSSAINISSDLPITINDKQLAITDDFENYYNKSEIDSKLLIDTFNTPISINPGDVNDYALKITSDKILKADTFQIHADPEIKFDLNNISFLTYYPDVNQTVIANLRSTKNGTLYATETELLCNRNRIRTIINRYIKFKISFNCEK